MSAFNTIIFEAICPRCGKKSIMRSQTYIASSFDGDKNGRFCGQEYNMGERMNWHDRTSPKFEDWRINDDRIKRSNDDQDFAEMCSITDCSNCLPTSGDDDLFALIQFKDLCPVNVVNLWIGDAAWPANHHR